MGLTPQQERFCQEYLIDLNATAAYRRAYPKCSTNVSAKSNARDLLKLPPVAARIAALQAERSERTAVTADWALRRLRLEAEFTGEGASHSARVSALGLAMKHLGMFVEDAPHPDHPKFDLTKLSDEQKRGLLAGLRLVFGAPAAGAPDRPAGGARTLAGGGPDPG